MVQRSALGRWLASTLSALGLALLAAGHILPVLHFALVAHELCAEHGALHHVEARPKASLGRVQSARSEAAVKATANAGHEDEDCSVVTTAGHRAVLEARDELTVLAPPSAPSRLSLCARAAERSVALLDYAPKLAPPV